MVTLVGDVTIGEEEEGRSSFSLSKDLLHGKMTSVEPLRDWFM